MWCWTTTTPTSTTTSIWLEKNPRITLHFTPTSGSWLNLIEVFFGIITRQAIRRGSFDNVKALAKTTPPDTPPGYQPADKLLAFLEAL